MAKGFLSGMLWGSVASVVGLGVVSLQIDPVEPSWSTASSSAQGVQSEQVKDAVDDVVPDVKAPAAPLAPAPAPPTEDTAADAVTYEPATQSAPVAEDTPPADEVQPATPAPDQAVAPDRAQTDMPQSIPDLANTPKIKSAPVTPISDQAKGVTTNRLPTINRGAQGVAKDDGVDALTVSAPSLAVQRNAVAFSNPDGRPLMAIVLTDQGASRTSLSGIKNLPFPVSFIVDASASDAAQAINFYLAAGAEVVLKPVLPAGATPSDAEVNFQSQKALTASTVGVFLDAESGFQSNSSLAAQVSDILAATGHGLVSQPQGLNTGHKTALKTGVAAGLVFRQFDDASADSAAIRRLLDNAAFKAGQENGVILLGGATSETLQALVEWSLGNRAKSVAMAPISAVLMGG